MDSGLLILGALVAGGFALSRASHADCGCGCKGSGKCGQAKPVVQYADNMQVPFQVGFNATFDSEEAMRQMYGAGPAGVGGGAWKGGRHGGNGSSQGYGGSPWGDVRQEGPIGPEILEHLYGRGGRYGGYSEVAASAGL